MATETRITYSRGRVGRWSDADEFILVCRNGAINTMRRCQLLPGDTLFSDGNEAGERLICPGIGQRPPGARSLCLANGDPFVAVPVVKVEHR